MFTYLFFGWLALTPPYPGTCGANLSVGRLQLILASSRDPTLLNQTKRGAGAMGKCTATFNVWETSGSSDLFVSLDVFLFVCVHETVQFFCLGMVWLRVQVNFVCMFTKANINETWNWDHLSLCTSHHSFFAKCLESRRTIATKFPTAIELQWKLCVIRNKKCLSSKSWSHYTRIHWHVYSFHMLLKHII